MEQLVFLWIRPALPVEYDSQDNSSYCTYCSTTMILCSIIICIFYYF